MNDKERKAAIEEGRRLEAERQSEINDAFQFAPTTDAVRALREQCLIDAECSADQARKLLLKEIGRNTTSSSGTPFQHSESPGTFSINGTRGQSIADLWTEAYLHRRGLGDGKISHEAQHFQHLSLREMARSYLQVNGSWRPGMSSNEEYHRFISTSDLTNVLANVANKEILRGFENAEMATHRDWTRAVPVNDYKPLKSVALGEIKGGLNLVGEGGEVTYTSVSDTGVDIQLARYERALAFTREAYINDDLSMLQSIPSAFGRASLRLEKDLVFAGLTVNPTMGDGTVLFHADHGNLGTAAAIGVDSLAEAQKLMRLQTNLEDEAYLDLIPAFLIVPAALEVKAHQIVNSIFDPDGNNSSTANPFSKKLQVIVEPRLDADSATAWYLVCSLESLHWFSRIYLGGNESPQVEGPKEDFNTSGMLFKCRHEFFASPIRWEGAVKNAGQ